MVVEWRRLAVVLWTLHDQHVVSRGCSFLVRVSLYVK